jgi:hypothetical protein
MNSINKYKNEIISYIIIIIVTIFSINLLIVKYPQYFFKQSFFPRTLLNVDKNTVNDCFKTFYPDTYNSHNFSKYNAVLGDSYGAGLGDDFLSGKYNYGIFHKLHLFNNENYLTFARGGFGNISSVRELKECLKLSKNNFLTPALPIPEKIIFLFYEGNDLNNNFDHLKRKKESQSIKDFVAYEINKPTKSKKVKSFNYPIINILKAIPKALNNQITSEKLIKNLKSINQHNTIIVNNKLIKINNTIQAAATELSKKDLDDTLNVFYESIRLLKKDYPNSKISIVYIPSVMSCYDWRDTVIAQGYLDKTKKYISTNSEENNLRSHFLRNEIHSFSLNENIDFIDTTNGLRQIARSSFIHGPKDWDHPNTLGYDEIANQIKKYLNNQLVLQQSIK